MLPLLWPKSKKIAICDLSASASIEIESTWHQQHTTTREELKCETEMKLRVTTEFDPDSREDLQWKPTVLMKYLENIFRF